MAGEWTQTPRRPVLMLQTQLSGASAGSQFCVKMHALLAYSGTPGDGLL